MNIFVYSTLGMYPVLNNLNICFENVKFPFISTVYLYFANDNGSVNWQTRFLITRRAIFNCAIDQQSLTVHKMYTTCGAKGLSENSKRYEL